MKMKKACNKCRANKKLTEFPKRKNSKDGYRHSCKQCVKEYQKLWHSGLRTPRVYKDSSSHKQCRCCLKIISRVSFRKKKTSPDGLYCYCKPCENDKKKLYKVDPDKIKKQRKRYYDRNKNKVYAKRKEKLETDKNFKKKTVERMRHWYDKNKERVIKLKKERRHSDSNLRIAENLRNRTRIAISSGSKSGSAVKDLGCSIKYLKKYLENKFKPGMSWSNYGEWHIDHIMPLSKFNLDDRKEFLQACHYTNLRPLWAKENLQRNNRVDDEDLKLWEEGRALREEKIKKEFKENGRK